MRVPARRLLHIICLFKFLKTKYTYNVLIAFNVLQAVDIFRAFHFQFRNHWFDSQIPNHMNWTYIWWWYARHSTWFPPPTPQQSQFGNVILDASMPGEWPIIFFFSFHSISSHFISFTQHITFWAMQLTLAQLNCPPSWNVEQPNSIYAYDRAIGWPYLMHKRRCRLYRFVCMLCVHSCYGVRWWQQSKSARGVRDKMQCNW